MTSLNSRGITPKSLKSMVGFVNPGFRGNGAGYLSEVIDSLRFEANESHEAPVEVREFINGQWRYIETV